MSVTKTRNPCGVDGYNRDIGCDLCGITAFDGDCFESGLKAIREEVKSYGWLRKKGKDICADCKTKQLKGMEG